MIPPYYKPLIDSLITTTISNKTLWNRTSSLNQFKLMLDKGMIVITNKNNTSTQYIVIEIYDEIGKRVDSISANNNDIENIFDFNKMLELYNLIIKQIDVLAQQTINDLISEIMSRNDSEKR